MSAQEAVADTQQQPVENNAQAAEDVKKMLAELQGETKAPIAEKPETAEPKGEVKEGSTVVAEDLPKREDAEVNGQSSHKQDDKENQQVKGEGEEKPRDRRDRDDHRMRSGGHGSRGRGGQHRGAPFNKGHARENIKSVVEKQEPSSDPVAIRKQVEFYFSDSNLPMDAFLLKQVGGSANNPVEIKTITSFKRMRHFQPFEAIVEALKESTFLELTDNNTCVRRREPLPEELNDGPNPEAVRVFEDRAMPRSIYAKGFGEEVPSTQFDIEAFFVPYGPTNAIRLRRTQDKIFKGSVFVEFETEALAEAFLALDPKPQYKGNPLQIMSKKTYCDQKVEDIKAGKIKANSDRTGGKYPRGNRDFQSKRKRDDREDNRDWRTRRDEDRKNEFRDDRKRDDRKGGRGARHGRGERNERGDPDDKDKDTAVEKREAATADAIARARAAVKAENEKIALKTEGQQTADTIEEGDEAEKVHAEREVSNMVDDSIKSDVDATTAEINGHSELGNVRMDPIEASPSKKRSREDDEGDVEREIKKVDSKSDVAAAAKS